MLKQPTNHKYNYTIRLYQKGKLSNLNYYQYIVNARNESQALYLAIKRFIKKHPSVILVRARVYSVTKNTPKTIRVNIPSISH